MSLYHIALGGNRGDVVTTMDAALAALDADETTQVTTLSRVFETAPVGVAADGVFLNAAAALVSARSPHALLQLLKSVERGLGRQPTERWSSRLIDLDLLLADRQTISDDTLTVPHPHLWYRRFVLDPLVDVAADVVHPVYGVTIGQLRARVLERPVQVIVRGGCAEERLALATVLQHSGDVRVESVAANEFVAAQADCSRGLRLELPETDETPHATPPRIDLALLPGSPLQAAQDVLTALLDEPTVHSRPLRRMP